MFLIVRPKQAELIQKLIKEIRESLVTRCPRVTHNHSVRPTDSICWFDLVSLDDLISSRGAISTSNSSYLVGLIRKIIQKILMVVKF